MLVLRRLLRNWEENDMVEWKKLGDVCNFQNGYAFKSGLFKEIGLPIIRITNISDRSVNLDDCKYFNFEDYKGVNLDDFIIRKGDILVAMSGATTGKIGFYNHSNISYLNQRVGKFIPHEEMLENRYLYHFLLSQYKVIYIMAGGGAQPNLSSNKLLNDLFIPIPSKSEQERIVSILDTFTSTISNLKEQIKERRKQYEYYRDQLLDLEGKDGVEMKTLGEIFSFKNGLNKGKDYFGKGKLIIMFSNVFNSRYIDSTMLKNRVDINNNELERINANKGDVFFTRTSETKEDVGYASVLLEDIKECTFAGFLIRARPILNVFIPEYCKYCFSTQKVRESIVCRSSFTTRASLTGNGLGKVEIPIPPKQTQSRIVSILDQFEASIANLEAQLKEREKQYEYYRNQLLTFE